MSHADTGETEEANVWDAFDETIEQVEEQLKQAWENHEVVQQSEEPLSEEYVIALTEIKETSKEFNSIYEVNEAELERANRVATNAEFLSTVIRAYREYHEGVIRRRVRVSQEWFKALVMCIEEAGVDVPTDRSSLRRQMQALEKLTNAGKYGQLLSSDRIKLADIEARIRQFNHATQEKVSDKLYVETVLDLAESFQNQYTNDLAKLVQQGVNKGAISITERVSGVPDLGVIATRLEEGNITSDHVMSVSDTIHTYADVVVVTGKRRKKYELGEKLITAIEDSSLSDSMDVEKDLRLRLNSFQFKPIEDLILRIIEGEKRITNERRLLSVLTKHDGSVRQTVQSLDRPTEEVFDDLLDLFLQDEIADLEVRFE